MMRRLLLVSLFGVPALIAGFFEVHAGQTPQPLTLNRMLEGYFRAGSAIRDEEALGYFAPSNNLPTELDRDAQPGTISLIALPEESVLFDPGTLGFRVILANNTGKTVVFHASDSRLGIVREALDVDGTWKPIEHLPSSFCGNSYHRVFLPSRHYWFFVAPVYAGSLATEMRFVLYLGSDHPVYSNQFPGFVNPEAVFSSCRI
jgi:hypothetical protein